MKIVDTSVTPKELVLPPPPHSLLNVVIWMVSPSNVYKKVLVDTITSMTIFVPTKPPNSPTLVPIITVSKKFVKKTKPINVHITKKKNYVTKNLNPLVLTAPIVEDVTNSL